VKPPRPAWLAPYQRHSRETLDLALREVPGYAAWRRFDPGPKSKVDERYAALPALTKRELREHFPSGFIPSQRELGPGLAAGEVEFAKTSGSTDDQVTLVFNPAWWEASERAAWGLNKHARRVADGRHREVVLASPRCVGPGFSPSPLSVAVRTIGRHLYVNQKINPASWSVRDIRRMAGEISDYEPLTLEGDPAYLATFARRVAELGIEVWQPRLIFLTYSFPARMYQRQIRKAFSAPLVSSYGSTEAGHVFMECEAGRLHQNSEHCRVDFLPWLPRHGGPLSGRILVTVFHNPWFIVLRFDIGDVVRLDDRGPCPCGRREGMVLRAVEGRVADVSFDAEGNAVTVDALDAALTEVPGLAGWQLDLPVPGCMRLRLLAAPGAARRACREAGVRLKKIYGERAKIEVAAEKALQHESSGKFRFVRTAYPVDREAFWKDKKWE
jgi:phenylacetate-coenzyme A ligase PaaK-like adenylate-forming protein